MSWTLAAAPSAPGRRTQPFGRLVERIKESGRPDLQPLSVFLDDGVVPRSSREDNYNRLGDDLAKYLVVKPGDIVFNKLRTWQGGLGVSRYTGIVSPAYFVCRAITAIEPRFLHYTLRSSPYLAEFTRISKWMPPSQFDISWDDLRLVPVALPALATQRAVADFLDAETARIDTFVSKKRQLVDLLNERIDAEIRQWVGASNLARSDPETPSVLIKRVLRKLARPPGPDGQMVTAYRDGQVTARALRRAEGYTDAWADGAQLQGVARDDVVVHGLDAFSGAVGSSEVDGVCSPIYHVCRPVGGGDPVFYGRMLRLLAASGYLALFATSTRERAVDLRNWDLFGRIPVPSVPIEQQWRLGNRIRKLAPLRVAIDKSAVLAAEHRQALITAAVMGERTLPGVAA